jgi:hypothetical protein
MDHLTDEAYSKMKRQDFLNAIRQNGSAFRADKISIDCGSSKVSGKGTLRVSQGRFLLDVTLDDLANVPATPMGFKGRSEFWKIRGLIEDEIEFCFEGMPSGRKDNYGHHPWKVLPMSSCFLDLIPSGLDALTTAERKKWRDDALKTHQLATGGDALVTPDANSTAPIQPDNDYVEVTFDAILRDYKLIAHNGGTVTTVKNDFFEHSSERSSLDTFHGTFEGWRFALIQKENDLDVHFWSNTKYKSPNEEEDRRLFRAFLNAVAFSHGKHTWPFLTEHHRDGRLVLDRVHLSDEVARTPHAPFTESLDGNARIGHLKWNFLEPLEKSYRFFCSNSKLSNEISHLLYLFRETSASGVPKRITLLGLCSLFESLIHIVYAERVAPSAIANTAAFESTRKKSIEALKLMAKELGDSASYGRVIGILTSAAPLRLKDEFELVLGHLRLGPEKRWQGIFDLWRDYRNPLSHRLSDEDESEASTKDQLRAESKIAGAINCLTLKLMGYSGFARLSAFEDEYGQI